MVFCSAGDSRGSSQAPATFSGSSAVIGHGFGEFFFHGIPVFSCVFVFLRRVPSWRSEEPT